MFKYTMKYKVLELISTMGEGGAESLVKDYALMINKSAFDISILTVYHVKHSLSISLSLLSIMLNTQQRFLH